MRETPVCTAADAIYKLAAGNLKYLNAENGSGDISRRIRMSTWAKGQSPYAIIVTCSDSRVIPENIFSAGIGELFVIRLAGNIIDDHQLGSIEYAAGHLGCRLVVVLGHTHCGAIKAALDGEAGPVAAITERIVAALGDVRDPHGIRPLVIGRLNDNYVFASETCAFDLIEAEYIRQFLCINANASAQNWIWEKYTRPLDMPPSRIPKTVDARG